MLRNRAELDRQLDAAKNDAAAAAELKAGMEARIAKILAAAS
jgi:hypothetical protein